MRNLGKFDINFATGILLLSGILMAATPGALANGKHNTKKEAQTAQKNGNAKTVSFKDSSKGVAQKIALALVPKIAEADSATDQQAPPNTQSSSPTPTVTSDPVKNTTPSTDPSTQAQLQNQLTMPEGSTQAQDTPPAVQPTPTPIATPPPVVSSETKTPAKSKAPTTARAAKPTPTPVSQQLAMNFPLKDAAGQAFQQITSDLPSLPSQPVINTLSQLPSVVDYYAWDSLSQKVTYNLLALAAFLAATGLFLVSGATSSLRRRRETEDLREPSVSF